MPRRFWIKRIIFNLLIMITINLFHHCRKVFILINILIGKWLGKIQWNIITWRKKDFYSHLNMEDITDASCMQAKRVCKSFEIKNLGEYHNLYVLGNTLLLANVFESFRNACVLKYMKLILNVFWNRFLLSNTF